jgi:hypothetical protein
MLFLLENNVLSFSNGMTYEILTALSTKAQIFWYMTPCNLVEKYRRFGDSDCLYPLYLKKLNSMVRVRERTIPTERPPLVGEVIANLCG